MTGAVQTISPEKSGGRFLFAGDAPMLPAMIALALGILACLFGIIALLPETEGFSDE